MSNIDKITANEELFTELTAEEGSVIKGGFIFQVKSAKAIKAGADFGWSNGDDVYARINGFKTRQTNDVDTGEIVSLSYWSEYKGIYTISLYDDDRPLSSDDPLGSFTFDTRIAPKGSYKKRISGSGSTYDVKFEIL